MLISLETPQAIFPRNARGPAGVYRKLDWMKSFPLVFCLLTASSAATAQLYSISTIAGTPYNRAWFGDGGPATTAQMTFPLRITVDSKGNYYIVDFYAYVIREVSAGIINTVAGNGVNGYQGDNYIAVQGEISDVHGIAVDSSGNIYLADTTNNRIRKVVPGGNITTYAGNGTAGYSGDGGAATSAELNHPFGVAVDSSGNVYIVDQGNQVLRKVATNGTISTFAGTAAAPGTLAAGGDGGPATKATFASLYAIAISPAGNIYVSDTLSQSIREITTNGIIQTVIPNVTAESLAVDAAGNIYYPDSVNNYVWKDAPGAAPVIIAGNGIAGYGGDGGPATFAELNVPSGIALDSSGNVYVADSDNYIVRLLTPVSMGIGAIENAASGAVSPIVTPPIPGMVVAPGEIVVIYGTGLGPPVPATNHPVNGVFGTYLAGTGVQFDNFSAPLLYTSATQVVAVVPFEEAIGNTAQVTVTYNNQNTLAAPAYVYIAPGVFTLTGNGFGQAAAVNQNGTLNSSAAPAPVGSVVSLYTTGEGQTTPPGADGALMPPNVLAHSQQTVTATVGGLPALVTYSGAAPGEIAGLIQVNVRIPAQVSPGNAVPVAIQVAGAIGNASSQTTATIAVSAN
jgi:uncharacterized protein (TIGR03437 family)